MKALLAECERLDPGSSPGLTAFFADASEKYRISFDKLVTANVDNPLAWLRRITTSEMRRTAIWRSLDSELGRFFRSRHIREAFGSYGMYLGGSPFQLPGIFSILPYGELAYGLWLPRGGIYALVQAIAKLAVEIGVKILTGTRVSRVIDSNGAVEGVQLEDGTLHPCPIVVSNADLPAKKMTPAVVTFYWGVRGALDNIGHHTIFLPTDYRAAFDDLCTRKLIPSGLPFYISIASATDPALAPPGSTTVFALIPTPLLSEMPNLDWDATVQSLRAQVLGRIGLAPSRIAVEHVWTPAEWQRRFGLIDGSAFGAAHTLSQIGPFRSRNYSHTTRGLYYTGAGTTPGTGMPMVVLSGKMTAQRIAERER